MTLRTSPAPALFLLAATWLAGPVFASAQTYELELPPRDMIAYRVQFEVPLPGLLELEANWTGYRVLSFRLDGPGTSGVSTHRSGPPPQRMSIEVDADTAREPGEWTLVIRGLPSTEASNGKLEIRFPEPASPTAAAPPVAAEPAAPEPEEPWKRQRPLPPNLPPERAKVFESTEAFRTLLVEKEPDTRDRYGWQQEFLRFMAEHRDRTELGRPVLTEKRRKSFENIVEAVHRVNDLANSTDPILSGPAPEDPLRFRTWVSLREAKIGPLENELDRLMFDAREAAPDDPEDPDWMTQFLSCLTACQRHFDQRVRLGEEKAGNRELTQEQWDRILAAADAMKSLTELGPTPDGD